MKQEKFNCNDDTLSFSTTGELKAYLANVPDDVLLFTENLEYKYLVKGLDARFDRIKSDNWDVAYKVDKYEGTFIGLCFC